MGTRRFTAMNNYMGDDLPGDWDEDEFMDEGINFPPMAMRVGGGGGRGMGGRGMGGRGIGGQGIGGRGIGGRGIGGRGGGVRGGGGRGRGFPRNFENDRYNNAYGDYRGGYGPGGGFGPPQGMFNGPNFYNGPPPPPLMMGQGFGPDGPPMRRKQFDDSAVKYLMRCGVPKENLKGLPRDLLKMIDPQFCALCGIQFDSFVMSRLHYISKNHSKNTKKFLKRGLDAEVPRAKEVPLKSRELYCELCDVQITSKPHASAHYAGKSHRSIVEGRKNPKNSALSQRGMEGRIEQLIRREKKFMKTVEEAEEPRSEKEDDKKVTTPPELYCEICKTCVTCTEQMTMHLNGKRHLTKEKQHILKMMKGDNSGSKKKTMQAKTAEAPDAAEDKQKKRMSVTTGRIMARSGRMPPYFKDVYADITHLVVSNSMIESGSSDNNIVLLCT
ncbi:hypothetical protein K1T71_003269 [Dendrolimus kikuchii]|uniref:Uncharacterized protein n=1 Tax=Dendrolimus kikuchii TaxID=765133 RepID=A0ACC1DB69_9NEOP|nr:hypothetical protein K1T71_003269 [Dendrolimus kikuchii]